MILLIYSLEQVDKKHTHLECTYAYMNFLYAKLFVFTNTCESQTRNFPFFLGSSIFYSCHKRQQSAQHYYYTNTIVNSSGKFLEYANIRRLQTSISICCCCRKKTYVNKHSRPKQHWLSEKRKPVEKAKANRKNNKNKRVKLTILVEHENCDAGFFR